MSAPVVTVDTPKITAYVKIDGHDWEYNGIDEFSGARTGGIPLVALPDALAHTARAVAAAKQEGWDSCALANQELIRQLREQIASQPVVGELPPLPNDSLIAVLYEAAEGGYRAEEYPAWCRRAADALKAVDGWCKARPAQPLPQPAAVGETAAQVQWRNINHAVREVAKFCFGGADHPQYGPSYMAMVNCFTAKDGVQIKLEPLPAVPAAGVQGETFTYASTQATNCAGCGKHKHTPLRVDDMGGYVCLTCIDQKLGGLLGEFGYAQPDSGRDAALDGVFIDDDKHNKQYAVGALPEKPLSAEDRQRLYRENLAKLKAADAFLAAHPAPSIDNVEVFTIPHVTSRGDKFVLLSDAHPAPSSDAAMFWYVAMPDGSHDGGIPYMSEEEARDYVDNRAIPGCSVRALYAHPANGAQAGDATALKAARYDWLREDAETHYVAIHSEPGHMDALAGEELDAAIDARILAAPQKKEG